MREGKEEKKREMKSKKVTNNLKKTPHIKTCYLYIDAVNILE